QTRRRVLVWLQSPQHPRHCPTPLTQILASLPHKRNVSAPFPPLALCLNPCSSHGLAGVKIPSGEDWFLRPVRALTKGSHSNSGNRRKLITTSGTILSTIVFMVLPSSSARSASSSVCPVSLSSLHQHPNSRHACISPSKPNHQNTHKSIKSSQIPRRSLFFLPVPFFVLRTPSSLAIDDTNTPSTSTIDTTITDRIYMDFSVCPSYFRSDRTLGAELSSCPDSEPLGRVVFGLYGRHLPVTTANFKVTCMSAAYRGTLVHKLLQGQFFAAGRQGSRRDKGPGPCPELDGQNIVFGTVLEGMDVITGIAAIPTYKPAERIRLFNDFAQLIGDERAQTARAMWNRPLKTVYIGDCGELKVTKQSLSPPSLP
ncbi:hypothetical protein EJB05_08809, partial [Eragrostis curvula]